MSKMKDKAMEQLEGPVPERWVVMTESKFRGGAPLFKAPARQRGEHWTTRLHHAKRMTEAQARLLVSKLRYGNPRALPYAEAAKLVAVKIREET